MEKTHEREDPLLEWNEELSQHWYCPNDKNMLQINHTRNTPSPYITISRANIAVGIENAVALIKIPPEASEDTVQLINFMFEKDPESRIVELVSVKCSICERGSLAPKLQKIVDIGIDRARALFEQYRALETKTFGPFRFVDHFGIGRYRRERGSSGRNLWFYFFFFGFRTIIMMVFLYYILGLEIRFGKKWLPFGPIIFILSIFGLIYLMINSNLLDPLLDIFRGFY